MRLAKALIRLPVCAGWSEPLLVAHTTLFEISCHGSKYEISRHYHAWFRRLWRFKKKGDRLMEGQAESNAPIYILFNG